MVRKEWLFQRGGRPVIYQTDAEFSLLPDSMKYRHVKYDPPETDFTWEREWRLQADNLKLEIKEATFVVPSRQWVEYFKEQHARKQRANACLASQIFGKMGGSVVQSMEWHFIALEDLGVLVDWPSPQNKKD